MASRADVEYVAILNDRQVLEALRRIRAEIRRAGQDAGRLGGGGPGGGGGFRGAGADADFAATKAGILGGAVAAVTSKLIELGAAGVRAMQDIAAESVTTALEFDVMEKSFGGIFKGNKEASLAALADLRKESRALGIDITELARSFLPKVGSLDEFKKIAKTASALALSDEAQGQVGAKIALQEALSGNLNSLGRRFEIPKPDLENIKKLQDELGLVDGLVEGLNESLKASGKDLDTLSNTGQAAINRIGESFKQLSGAAGTPFVDELKDQLNDVNAIFQDNFSEFQSLAGEIGGIGADILDAIDLPQIAQFFADNRVEIQLFVNALRESVGEILEFAKSFISLEDIDTEGLVTLGNDIYDIVTAVQLFLDISTDWISQIGEMIGLSDGLGGQFQSASELISGTNEELVFLSDLLAKSKAGYAGLAEVIKPLIEYVKVLAQGLIAVTTLDFGKAQEFFDNAQEIAQGGLFDVEAGQQAARASYEESTKKIEEYGKAVDDQRQRQEEYRKELETTADATDEAGLAAADALLAETQADKEAEAAAEEAAAAAEELAAAQEKVAEAMGKLETDRSRDELDLLIDAERKATEAAIDAAQKREDIARDNARKIEDIRSDHADKVEDAAKDLTRKEEDIARKQGQDRANLESDLANKRVDIESNFRKKLQDIQRQFLQSATEAEKTRDAVAFLRAKEQRDQQIGQAQEERGSSIEELAQEGEQRREELARQQEQEREEAQLANERKLEDLKEDLERELEEQKTSNERALEDAATAEQRKQEELARQRQEAEEDLKLSYERKQEDLNKSLETELALLAEAEAQKTAVVKEETDNRIAEAEREAQAKQKAASKGGKGKSSSSASKRFREELSRGKESSASKRFREELPRRQSGGAVAAGQAVSVNENQRPETFSNQFGQVQLPGGSGTFMPDVPGNISPALPNAMPAQQNVNNVDNSKTNNLDIGVLDPATLSPAIISLTQQAMLDLLEKV